MPVRKNARLLTADQKSEFIGAVLALKASNRYDPYVLRHAQAPSPIIHRAPIFLPWHRSFILDFEKELQQLAGNPNLGLPYWNWAEDAALPDPATSPIWAADFMGGDGDPTDSFKVKTGPFREGQWTIVNSMGNPAGALVREFGRHPAAPTLPTQADIDAALNTTPYDRSPWNSGSIPSFRNRLEGWYGAAGAGLHNRGHVWMGGSMLPMTSPNDVMFFLHHCFVDKIWADWQAMYLTEGYLPTGAGPPGQNLNDLMEPTVSGQVTPADMLDHRSLGYTYDRALSLLGGVYELLLLDKAPDVTAPVSLLLG